MENESQPKSGIEQQVGNSTLGGGMQANQGDNNNLAQGDGNIQQQGNSAAQVNKDNSTGIQVRANGGTNNIAKEINQYNIVVYQNSGASERSEYDFQPYLSSVVGKHQQWSSFYTLTDTLGKQVEMLLMVESIQPKRDKHQFDEGDGSARSLDMEREQKGERLPVIEAISKYAREHVLLVGKPGSGKSTALQRLMWSEADKIIQGEKTLDVIPVLVELRGWLKQTNCVTELIQKSFQKNNLRLKLEAITDLLLDGRLLLLVDGLNELPSDESRRIVADFREEYQQTPMVFTTRDLALGGDLGIKKQLSMQPLTVEQMHQLVRAYLPEQAEGMLKQLGDRLRELGETSLILKMLCDVFKKEKKIPNSPGELFRYFDATFDKLKEDERVQVPDELLRWKAELLENLAFAMMRGEKITDLRLIVSRTQAEEVLENSLSHNNRVSYPAEKAKAWLQDLLKYYLIQPVDKKYIQFHHQLFQEYYAAEYLLRILPSLSDEELKKDYLNLLKWTEPLALMLALLDNEVQAVRVVRLALDVDLMLGARLAGKVKFKFQNKTVDLIANSDISQRLKIELLGVTRSKQAHSLLLREWENSSFHDNADYVAEALSNIGDDEAINYILSLQDKHHDEMNAAAYNEDCHNLVLCDNIADALENIDSSNEAVLDILKLLNDQSLLNKGSNIYLKPRNYQAIKILKEDFFNKCLILLSNLLENKDYKIRYRAALALMNIDSDVKIKDLNKAIEDEYISIRINAVKAIAKLSDDSTVTPLLIRALNDKNSRVRSKAADALGKFSGNEVTNALIKALDDKVFIVRSSAVNSLGRMNCKQVLSYLIQSLHDENRCVRDNAVNALVNFATKSYSNKLVINALKPESSHLAVIYTLKKIDDTLREANKGELIDYVLKKNALTQSYPTQLEEIEEDKFLPKMQDLLLAATNEMKDVILEVQEKHQFYNYEIFHSPPLTSNKTPENHV